MGAQGRVGSGGKGAKKRIPTEKDQEELKEAYKRMKKGGRKITQAGLGKEASMSKSKAAWYLNNCDQPDVLRLEDKRGEQG